MSTNSTPHDDDASLQAVGAMLGDRYVVERRIGRGGMATVWLARDTKHDRLVAVKVLHPELSASIGAERFLREIRLAATLQHPHVLGMYDSGSADGQLYYVMPYAEGESLRDRIDREQQLPVDEALRIAGEVARALAYAHERGVVHRDIKPENVLLSDGHAIVADFGIARAVTSAGAEKLTESGMAIGTPVYMSPEQGMGVSEVTGAADIYSLGCVLYEMLTGEPPYTGANPMAVLARHSMAEIPSARIVRSTVSPDVERIIQRALAKSPADRFANAGEMAKALQLAAANTTAAFHAAPPQPPRTRAQRRIRTGLLAAAAVAVVAAVAVAASNRGWGGSGGAVASAEARKMAVLYFESRDSTLRDVADALTEALATSLQATPNLTVVSTNGTLRYRDARPSYDAVATALNVGTLVTGVVEPEGANVRVTLALRDASGAEIDRASLVRPRAELLALREGTIEEMTQLVRDRFDAELASNASRVGTRNTEAWIATQRAQLRLREAEAAARAGDSAVAARADAAVDSLLGEARRRDPAWSEPLSLAAQFAYKRSRRFGVDPVYAEPHITRGLAVADSAVARDSSADALEARGSLRYWQWLLKLGSPDQTVRSALFRSARADLEAATAKKPTQAGAWAILSHLYTNASELPLSEAKLAAQKAYEADAYVTGAEPLLARLASISYDLEQFTDARRYCGELQRRAPANPRGVQCALLLMGTKAERAPSADSAWRLAARRDSLAPAAQREFTRLDSELAVAMVLANASMRDSALAVVKRAIERATPAVDPGAELRLSAAHVYLMLQDRKAAIAQLKEWVAVNGVTKGAADAGNGWWLRELKSDPEYLRLFGA